MELLQLQYFFDSARTENFAKTAEKYLVPPSSVSASVKRLESELGCKLFDRHSNKITLNENGRKLQRSLWVIFGELDHLKSELTSQDTDNVKIKLLVRSLRSRTTDAIIDYRKTHPNVHFEMVFDMKEDDPDSYDLIIDERTDSYVGLQKIELCSARIRIKAATDSHLCGRVLTMSQLRNQPFITMGQNSNLHKMLLRACKNAGFTPNIVMETNDEHCYSKCIASGMGIGLGRETIKPASNAKLTSLLVSDFEELQIFYVYYAPKKISSHIKEFIEFLKCRDF